MYAVIKTGGKQYRVEEGQVIDLEKLEGNVGDKLTFDKVLMVGGETSKVGAPTIEGASVTAEIVAQHKGKKLIVFKFQRRKDYQRKHGHRQKLTRVKISGISA